MNKSSLPLFTLTCGQRAFEDTESIPSPVTAHSEEENKKVMKEEVAERLAEVKPKPATSRYVNLVLTSLEPSLLWAHYFFFCLSTLRILHPLYLHSKMCPAGKAKRCTLLKVIFVTLKATREGLFEARVLMCCLVTVFILFLSRWNR